MKVYVVYYDEGHGMYSGPVGAFYSREAAKGWCEEKNRGCTSRDPWADWEEVELVGTPVEEGQG